jgi:hypothetical protein
MPIRFSILDSSVPGPCVGGAGGCGDTDGAGQARADPQKKSSTPQTVQRFVRGSQLHSCLTPAPP